MKTYWGKQNVARIAKWSGIPITQSEIAAIPANALLFKFCLCHYDPPLLAAVRKVVVTGAQIMEDPRHGDFAWPKVKIGASIIQFRHLSSKLICKRHTKVANY